MFIYQYNQAYCDRTKSYENLKTTTHRVQAITMRLWYFKILKHITQNVENGVKSQIFDGAQRT